jgi:hypothetical protein
MYNSNNTGLEVDGMRYLGIIALSVPAPTPLTLGDTYYKVLGTFVDTGLNDKFTPNADGSVVYNGEPGTLKIFGTADVTLNGPNKLTFALYKNDVLIPEAQTPHDFDAANKSENISITGAITIATNDKLQVWAKSSSAGDVLTPQTLNMLLEKR